MAGPVSVDLIKAIFKKIDSNGDGTINQDELVSIFKAFDTDGDGKITKDEFVDSFVNKFGGNAAKAERVFAKLDRNNSGDVSDDNLKQLFAFLDVDKDGSVSEAEFIEKWTELLSK